MKLTHGLFCHFFITSHSSLFTLPPLPALKKPLYHQCSTPKSSANVLPSKNVCWWWDCPKVSELQKSKCWATAELQTPSWTPWCQEFSKFEWILWNHIKFSSNAASCTGENYYFQIFSMSLLLTRSVSSIYQVLWHIC